MARDLEHALECIQAHPHRCSIETLVVNKPSDDGTEALIAGKYPWARLLPHDGVFSFGIMRNVGIRGSSGRYCLMLDTDTDLLPGCFDALVDFMDAHPDAGGCGGHTTRPGGEIEYSVKRFYDLMTLVVRRSPVQSLWPNNPWTRRHLMMDQDHSHPFEGDWMAGACFCMRRETIDQIGMFDEKYILYVEDTDWCWRARQAGWKIAFVPEARIVHKPQRRSGRRLFSRANWLHLKSGLRFWWKTRHQGLNWAWPNRPLRRPHEALASSPAAAAAAATKSPRDANAPNAPTAPESADSASGSAKSSEAAAPEAAGAAPPDLSVIVINLNGKRLLRDCLESLRQSAPRHRLDVIVVDNGSADGSPEMVRAEFPEARLIVNATNQGFTRANNQGIRIATGRYLLLLNNDTRVLPAAFSDALDFLDRNPEIGAAGLKLLNEDGSLQLSCRRFPSFSQAVFNRYSLLTRLFPNNRFSRAYLMTDLHHDREQDVDWVSGACLLFRRDVLDAIGPLDERFFMYSEDVDFCYRVWEGGWRVTYLPFAQVYHLIGQDTKKVRYRLTIERHKSMYKFYKKHYSRDLMFLDTATALMVAVRCGALLASMTAAQALRRRRGAEASAGRRA